MERIAEAFVRRRRQLIGRGEAGQGRRYPKALVGLALRFAEAAATAGWSQREIADRLELPVATLTRWRNREGPGGEGERLHEVVVVARQPAGAGEPRDVVAVVTPDGFRIEGLGVGSVAPLLEALRR